MKTKKNNGKWYTLLIVGIVLIIGGIIYSIYSTIETNQKILTANDAVYATSEDEICYAPAQFLSDPYAAYDDNEELQFYFAFDEYGTPYVIYMHDDTFANYQELYDYFYTDETNAPSIQNMYGKTVAIDSDLRSFTEDAYNELFGSDIVDDSTFDDTFGYYYLDLDAVSTMTGSYFHFNIGIFVGAFMFLAGLINVINRRNDKEIVYSEEYNISMQNDSSNMSNTSYDAMQETSSDYLPQGDQVNSPSQEEQSDTETSTAHAPVYSYAAEKYAKEDRK